MMTTGAKGHRLSPVILHVHNLLPENAAMMTHHARHLRAKTLSESRVNQDVAVRDHHESIPQSSGKGRVELHRITVQYLATGAVVFVL